MIDFKVLEFTSPTPPPSLGICHIDSILKGFGYSSPLLDFTISSPQLTNHLTIEQDHRTLSYDQSPGLQAVLITAQAHS